MHGKEHIEIRVEDADGQLVGENYDEVAALLRVRYPDGSFERFLKVERDWDAELKREAALEELATIVTRAALDKCLEEELALTR